MPEPLVLATLFAAVNSSAVTSPPPEMLGDIEDTSVIVHAEFYSEATVIERTLDTVLDVDWNSSPPDPPSGANGRTGVVPPDSQQAGGSSSESSSAPGQYCMAGPDETVSTDAGCISLAQQMGCLTLEYTPMGGAQCTATPSAPDEDPPEDLPEPPSEPDEEDEDITELLLTYIPGMVETAFSELQVNGGSVAFDEQLLGFGYINQHTNVFAEVETQTVTVDLLGFDVEIRATPAEYHFSYGDGATHTTADPGGPAAQPSVDAETATSHVYTETGRFPVAVTTTFIGEYRLLDGPWTAIAGTTTVESSPGEADIWRTDHQLVAEDCPSGSSYGCEGPFLIEDGDQPPEIYRNHYDQQGNWRGH